MKKYIKGKYVELTAEEFAEMAKWETAVIPEPTILERLEAIEAMLLEEVLAGD